MQSLFDAADVPTGITLSALTRLVSATLHTAPGLQNVWVTAEIGNLAVRGGHCYLELIEKNDAQQTVAKLRANIWAGVFNRLSAKFMAAAGASLSAGIKVMLRGSVTNHDVYGLSFNVTDIDPNYTMGDLVRMRREIMAMLRREGIADRNKSLPTPDVPQRIAVISSATAAGYGDFMNQLQGNARGFVFYPVLFPSIMQGNRTSASVRAALQRIAAHAECFDCVVIIRGGGATSDLIDFDEPQLARAVALCPLPVIVGIGHERDTTVLDEIAHTRVKTPTAAAEWLIGRMLTFADHLDALIEEVIGLAADRVSGEQRRLAYHEGMIPAAAQKTLAQAATRLQQTATALPLLAGGAVNRARQTLQMAASAISNSAASHVMRRQSELKLMQQTVTSIWPRRVVTEKDRLRHIYEMTQALSPMSVLKRGYSITRTADGQRATAATVSSGQTLITSLADGTVTSTVK